MAAWGLKPRNYDYFEDLVCQFEDDTSEWLGGEDDATLSGELVDDTLIEGSDAICVVP